MPLTWVFLRLDSPVTLSAPSVVSPVTVSLLPMVTSPLRFEASVTFREPAFTAPVVVIAPSPASTPSPFSLPCAVTLPRLSTVTLPSIVVSFLASMRSIPAVRLLVAAIASALALMLSALVLILPSSAVISPLFVAILFSSSVSLSVRAFVSAASSALVLYSCLPVTASVELSLKVASFRCVIFVPSGPLRVIVSFTSVSYFTLLLSSVAIFSLFLVISPFSSLSLPSRAVFSSLIFSSSLLSASLRARVSVSTSVAVATVVPARLLPLI